MARLSYMQRRRSGIYEFRKRLPTELAAKPAPSHVRAAFPELVNPNTGCFKGELVRSLGTHDAKQAKRLNLKCAIEAQRQFDAALRAMSNPVPVPPSKAPAIAEDDLAAIEAETFADLLARDEEERTEGDDRRRLQSREERAQWPDLVPIAEPWAKGMAADHAHMYGIAIEELRAEFREAYARRDPGIVRSETNEALRRRKVPIDPTSPVYHQIGMAVLRGTVRAYDAMAQRQRGDIVETPSPTPRADKLTLNAGPKLSEAFALWQEGNGAAGAKKPGRSGILEARAAVRWFIELHGDMRLGAITKAHAREYQRALAKYPKRLPEQMRGLSLRQVLMHNLDAYERRGAATINKSITMLAAIVSYAQREGLLDDVPNFVNPFGKDVKLRVDRRTEEGREPFQPTDLAAIFGTAAFTKRERPRAGGEEAAFWLPIVALLSGMRLEEIAGLRLADLAQDEETGTWVFDVNPRGGRSVKTVSSIRKVPVHPQLIKIGLLHYRQFVADRGVGPEGSLWPGLKSAEGRPVSAQWSKWFGRYLRDTAGITDRRKVFHSFRHTFKRMARDAGIPEEIHDAMTGHAGNGGVGKSYGRGVSLRPLIEAMKAIEAPEAVAVLAWHRPSNEAEKRPKREPAPAHRRHRAL